MCHLVPILRTAACAATSPMRSGCSSSMMRSARDKVLQPPHACTHTGRGSEPSSSIRAISSAPGARAVFAHAADVAHTPAGQQTVGLGIERRMLLQIGVNLGIKADIVAHPVYGLKRIPAAPALPVELGTAVDDGLNVELVAREQESHHRSLVVGLAVGGDDDARPSSAVAQTGAPRHTSISNAIAVLTMIFFITVDNRKRKYECPHIAK